MSLNDHFSTPNDIIEENNLGVPLLNEKLVNSTIQVQNLDEA